MKKLTLKEKRDLKNKFSIIYNNILFQVTFWAYSYTYLYICGNTFEEMQDM
jgi:hypothetical protein